MPARSIDIHTHILTEEAMAQLARESPRVAPILKERSEDGAAIMEIDGKIMQRVVPRALWDVDWRLRDMAANDVDVQLLSPTTQTFFYDIEPGLGAACAALQNELIAQTVRAHPGRFIGLAALPLQAPERAADELRRAMTRLDLRGAEIGSNVGGRNLDDPQLEPVWATAAELGAFILVHPHNIGARERMQSYYLSNFVGLPFETTLAAASLVFGGVLARHPRLKFCFSHGGGFVPYQAGRFLHGWEVRPESKARLAESPAQSLALLNYDSIVHSRRTLDYLVDLAGHDHVLLGSDYPFDMGNLDCVRRVRELDIPDAQRDGILGGNARRLLGWSAAGAGG
jgi:aminocarboxymuconate-semialdehyde decarboxylase